MVHTVPLMIAMAILIVLGVLIVAEFQTKRIVAPINRMDRMIRRRMRYTMSWLLWFVACKSKRKRSASR